MHRNLNFSALWRHWKVLFWNNSSIANALKFKFLAYTIIWKILLGILFALNFRTPRNQEFKTDEKIDVEVYARLVELDTKLGTRTSEQLFLCLFLTTRLDIIKVRFYTKGLNIAMILDYRLERSPRIWLSARKKLGWICWCLFGSM